MTAATLRPGTFYHIRGEKKGAGSIDVNYADVTREGAQWSVSPPKESIKVKQLVFPSFFFPLQHFNSVTTATMCCITAHVNTHPTKLYLSDEITSTTPQINNSCARKRQLLHSKRPPAQIQRSLKSLTCKLGERCRFVMKWEFTKTSAESPPPGALLDWIAVRLLTPVQLVLFPAA